MGTEILEAFVAKSFCNMALSERDTMAYEVERTMRTIFRRCLQCPDTTPSCPSCKTGEICSLVPADCNTCAYNVCIANPNPPPKSPGPNIGAIAGGVIGGVAGIAIIVFFIWRFWIKKRREQQELEAEEWEEDDIAQQKAEHERRFQAFHTDGMSTRTRGSLANSILSRASNIIQIAYIPGVTNRNGNGSGHNSLLASAPVPPVPAAQRGSQPPKSPLSNEGDALFFRPGDLRDSSYSATSSLASAGNNRDTQYTRQSITPSLARSSMASEVYHDDASQMPMPATTVARAAPKVISIKSAGSPTEPAGSPTPTQDLQVMMPGESSDGHLTPSSSLRGQARQVTVGKGKGRFPVRQASDASSNVSRHAPAVSSPLAEVDNDDEDEEEEEHARARQSYFGSSTTNTSSTANTTPPRVQPVESPFFDASEHPPSHNTSPGRPNPYASMASTVGMSGNDLKPKRGGKGAGGLSDIIEEATKRASRVPSHEGLGGRRDGSPFGDQFATD